MHSLKIPFLLSIFVSTASFAETVFDPINGNFTLNDVVQGVGASASLCNQAKNAVWVEAGGIGECIRYYPSEKITPMNAKKAIVYFSGDLPVDAELDIQYLENYSKTISIQALNQSANVLSFRVNYPIIHIARPGILGSSGNHSDQRRRFIESALMNEALTKIKQKLNFNEITLVGHSGGGHVAASIGTLRNDIKCNVLASSVNMPQARANAAGYSIMGLYEPKDYLTPLSKTRYLIIGDQRDKVVHWDGQGQYARELRKKGIQAENIVLKSAKSNNYHNLLEAGVYAGALCASGTPTSHIVKQLHTRYDF